MKRKAKFKVGQVVGLKDEMDVVEEYDRIKEVVYHTQLKGPYYVLPRFLEQMGSVPEKRLRRVTKREAGR